MTFNECVSQYLTHSSCLFKCQISHGFFFSSCWKSHANNNQFWLMPSSRSAGNVRSGRFKRLEQKTMPVTPPREPGTTAASLGSPSDPFSVLLALHPPSGHQLQKNTQGGHTQRKTVSVCFHVHPPSVPPQTSQNFRVFKRKP